MAEYPTHNEIVDLVSHPCVADGQCALFRKGKLVWMGPLTDPIEDIAYDCMMLSPTNYRKAMVNLAHLRANK